MKENKGFIELFSVKDYWQKLENDFANLTEHNEDPYIAFNFFVTAYHLIDWIFEGTYSEERAELNRKPILKLCSHIANGIKHFETDQNRHNSVKSIEKQRYVEEGYWETGYVENPIVIYFEDELLLEFGESQRITDLATLVMGFWKSELNNRNLI